MRLLAFINKIKMDRPEVIEASADMFAGFSKIIANTDVNTNACELYHSSFELIRDELKDIDEFAGVNKFNFLTGPTFMSDAENGEPVEKSDTFIGGAVKFQETVTLMYDPEQPIENFKLKFADVVDLYSIRIASKPFEYKELAELMPGSYLLPTINLDGTIEIFVKADLRSIIQINQQFGNNVGEKLTSAILKRVENLLQEPDKSNVPRKPVVFIRVSSRSIIKDEETTSV